MSDTVEKEEQVPDVAAGRSAGADVAAAKDVAIHLAQNAMIAETFAKHYETVEEYWFHKGRAAGIRELMNEAFGITLD